MHIDPEHPRLWLGLLSVHILAGVAAVTLGWLPMFSRKGGAFHRRWGRRFAVAMSVVVACAAALSLLEPRPLLVALTIAGGLQLFSGLRVLRRKRPDLDPAQRATATDWIVTLAALAVAIGALATSLASDGGNPTVMAATLGTAIMCALWDIRRFSAPAGWPFFPGLWFYEHLVKLTAVMSAGVSALSGNVLVFTPDPWRQLWASILFGLLIVVMVVYYAARRRPATA